ncbi:TPA: hypothetical protein TY768_000908 [Streptococcus suis]|nr:hypothetical protein [Streptococcus suis]
MNKQEVIEKYKAGFVVFSDKHRICDEEWILDKDNSTESELRFLGYDANLWPLPEWKKFDPERDFEVKRVRIAKKVTVDFNGKVYLDSVCISDIELEETDE